MKDEWINPGTFQPSLRLHVMSAFLFSHLRAHLSRARRKGRQVWQGHKSLEPSNDYRAQGGTKKMSGSPGNQVCCKAFTFDLVINQIDSYR